MKTIACLLITIMPFLFAGNSTWVSVNSQGKLTYKTTDRGDRIIDFSYAGYGGGGVPIPSPEVKMMVSAVAGDNTANIQQAIDAVAALK